MIDTLYIFLKEAGRSLLQGLKYHFELYILILI